MQFHGGRLVLSPTDLTRHVACPHATALDLRVALGDLAEPEPGTDEQLQLVLDRGLEHERAYLARLRAEGRTVVEIPPDGPLAEREQQTLAAMREGADVIYQAVMADGAWSGIADFLLRDDAAGSGLGPFGYDVADTKLARRPGVPALLQLASYAERLQHLQGRPPRRLVVVTGDGAERPFRHTDVASYARRVRERVQSAVREQAATEPVPVAHCAVCRWRPRCSAEWEANDDLTLVAGMRTDHRLALREAGIHTLTELARADEEALTGALSRPVARRLRTQARLQRQERETGEATYALLPARPGQGLGLLPAPDEGDIYLDFEGDPFAEDGQGREYLAGVCERDGTFHAWWAHDQEQEAQLVADLVDWLLRRWQRYPGMHVYHYASYEQSKLKLLTGRYATRESELDQLLRGERLVDLYAVVRQGLQISKASYSLKQLEAFYWHRVRTAEGDAVTDALSSVVEYERWLAGGRQDDVLLQRLADYNAEDVRSTLALHDWLEERRSELERQAAEPLPRPEHKRQQATVETGAAESAAAEEALATRLREAGEALLAGAVGWHRREARSEWWDYYRTGSLSDEELREDGTTIGALGEPSQVGRIKRSVVWRYPFPPQDGSVRVGSSLHDVDTKESAGEVVGADLDAGWVEVKRGTGREPLRPRGLGPPGPLSDQVMRESLARTGEDVLSGDGGLAAALLRRQVPTGMAPGEGETAADVVMRVGTAMATSTQPQVLAVQGPPGSGKTYAGTRLVRALVDAGLRVGVTGLSHAVIDHLMQKVERPGLRKPGAGTEVPDDQDRMTVRLAGTAEEVRAALADGQVRLAGGTAWLWARQDMRESVDVLVVDEAGQFSLANALAVAPAARSMVLLGDPQQLTQPSRATHPDGSGVSALEHLLEGQETVTTEQGIFLDRTWRMHPALTEFVSELAYDGRLGTAAGRERQEVLAGAAEDWPGSGGGHDGLTGSGLRWLPVEHQGFSADNSVEADAVAALVQDLLGRSWRDVDGQVHPIGPEDVLVVAPFNAHVSRLADALPDGVRAGTVDRFQGRQAPVVIYSMASSTAADAPRGVGFLYDTHRLNVALSRAQALAVVVGSPALLDAPVSSAEQLRAVNALCRLVDLAEPVLRARTLTA
ncbi:TM0106 family RecB-like putative nuclease [Ornithinicoccus halotolerans]|uniref:TM0106 family RecB-like putative nuclease n=1 Tax=Ornithinicoccus halotolerans TaxID=1748220 RepID=UPI00129805D5|nr:TM0106 family RecB-like putative nuclease [Ornithinicoccus halotolerans]